MSKRQEKLLGRIARQAAASVHDPAQWRACVESIGELTQSPGVSLFQPEAAPADGTLGVCGIFIAGVSDYFGHWIRQDPWNQALKGTGRFRHAGEIIIGEDLVPASELRRTAYWQDHARLQDSGHKLFLKVMGAGDHGTKPTHLTLGRSFQQAPYGPAEVAQLRALLPSLRNALKAQRTLAHTRNQPLPGAAELELLPHPCVVLQADRTIDHANGAARRAFGRWLHTASLKLRSVGDADEALLERMLRGAELGLGLRSMVGLEDSAERGLVRATLHAVPVRDSGWALSWPTAAALLLLHCDDDDGERRWIEGHLARRYRLTPTECRVLVLLAAGHEVPSIASRLEVGLETVRTHLRSLREKTGRRSQSHLLRLAMGR